MTTWAPNWDNTVAIPFPSPVPPPVMKAVFPLKVPSGNIGVAMTGKCLAWSLLLACRTDVDVDGGTNWRGRKKYNWAAAGQNQQNHVCPAKTQISQRIHTVWSGSLLCAQWEAKDPRFLHADSEDSDQIGRMPRLIWLSLCLAHRLFCWFTLEKVGVFSNTEALWSINNTAIMLRWESYPNRQWSLTLESLFSRHLCGIKFDFVCLRQDLFYELFSAIKASILKGHCLI